MGGGGGVGSGKPVTQFAKMANRGRGQKWPYYNIPRGEKGEKEKNERFEAGDPKYPQIEQRLVMPWTKVV